MTNISGDEKNFETHLAEVVNLFELAQGSVLKLMASVSSYQSTGGKIYH
jgi:hypothetical protein